MVNTKDTSESHASREPHKTSQRTQKPQRPQRTKRTQSPERARTTTNREGKDDVAEDRPSPMEVLREARAQLTELTGMTAESVSSFEQTEDGWSLDVEVLELARVPDTMSLMASYQVDLDPQGQLTGYRRVRRYERGRSDSHRPGGR
ncbi:gas vesicle protein GvpO [Streptomyces maremycinicus]|uniref:gas vesicle protein GvpO n=1 Tax=Streptomyces maremycinicus TaxID=1679753 RepID=UPI00099DF8F8|nr:gas vesicle protein [Streptomyces sp. NBRC 110468]